MKNKILILISLLIFVLAIKNVYAEETATVKCTASDFRSGRYGCKDTYKMETYFGGYVTATCIKEYYEKGTYGCKDTYEVNSKGKVEVACTDSDFDKGTHGCKKTYENEVYPGWSVDVTCEAAFYETGEHGCKDTYEVNYVSTSNNES